MSGVIGITDCEKYPNYERWIKAAGAEVLKLSAELKNEAEVVNCAGILITGGDDIHPSFYGRGTDYPDAPEYFVEDRDRFEMAVLRAAEANRIPVLGVCRGLQLINVVHGGTLIQDLGQQKNITHQRVTPEDKYHQVNVQPGSVLQKITGVLSGEVNSSHHQAIDQLGQDLAINCKAEDGTIEGIEKSDDDMFLLAVQWHPERMKDLTSPLSQAVRDAFLSATKKR